MERPHRDRIKSQLIELESIQTAKSPDINPIEYVWDVIGRKLNEMVPACQNLTKFRNAVAEECQIETLTDD